MEGTDTPIDQQDADYSTYDEAAVVEVHSTAAVEAFEPSVAAREDAPAKETTLLDPESQKLFDGQAITELLQNTRTQIAAGKAAYRLSVKNLGQGQHPNQIREGLEKLEVQLAEAIAMATELEASETGIAPPSPIEIAATADAVGLNRAQRRHPARG